MTSIAEPAAQPRAGSWIRVFLLVAMLAGLAAVTALPWGGLWLLVPLAVCASLVAGWRFGARGVLVPLLLLGAAIAIGGPQSLWASWVPAAALTGVWMGLREEGGGPTAGDRAFMLLPLLLLAGSLPWMVDYSELVGHVRERGSQFAAAMLDASRQAGYSPERMRELEQAIANLRLFARQSLQHLIPTAFFLWMVLLVSLGRSLAARVVRVLRWPQLSGTRIRSLRLPDGALWLFIASLAMLVAEWSAWAPTAWTLLLNTGLGFCIQGIAVVESLLLARGVPSTIIILTLLFVFIVTGPFFMATAAAVGLSDVWLDYRRLEPSPHGEPPA